MPIDDFPPGWAQWQQSRSYGGGFVVSNNDDDEPRSAAEITTAQFGEWRGITIADEPESAAPQGLWTGARKIEL